MATPTRDNLGSLPLELSSFIGREDELAEAKARLGNARLVTLTGVGGVGKTRLAVRLAEELRPGFEDGVWFIELDQVVDATLLANTVAATLGLRELSAQPLVDVLEGYLAERRLLLVLDNCEHLLDACAALAVRLLQRCPDVRVLATSREPLGVPGEAIVSVPPLAVPEGDARLYGEVTGFDAVTLFAERATAVVPDFRLGEENQAAVADICHRLDGLPLAIELAAARLRTLPVDEIARRLNDRYHLLSTRMRGVPSRHQTLWASLEWSYDLCSREERRLWERLSVFRGGFELDAAEAVCAADDLPTDAILDLVTALVDKSIVLRDAAGARARYRLLETIRDFGWAKVGETGDVEVLRRRHRDWYDRFVQEADADWIGPRQADWLDRMDRDLANLRAAFEFCLREPAESDVGLRMVAALGHCYGLGRGRLGETRHALEQALRHDAAGRNPSRPRALYVASLLAMFQGDIAGATALADELRVLADDLGDASARELATRNTGSLAFWTGDYRRATAYFRESLMRSRQEGDIRGQAEVLIGLGECIRHEDPQGAAACLEEVLAITEPRGDMIYRSYSLWALGIAAWRSGDPQRAVSLLTKGLTLKHQIAERMGEAWCLDGLAWISTSTGQYLRAARLLGAAQALADATGTSKATAPFLDREREECEQQARSRLGDGPFESAFEDGMAMRPDDAFAFALIEAPPIAPSAAVRVDPRRWLPTEQLGAVAESLPPPPPARVALWGSIDVAAAGEPQRPHVRVLIVDRNRVEADGIKLVLEQHSDLTVVGLATNAAEGVRLASETQSDVILADYQLLDATGAELARRLGKDHPASRVLVLSALVNNALLQEAVKAGARGFLLKTQPAEELVDAVRRAAAGEMLIPAGRLAALIAGSDKSPQLLDLLTGREREVLRLLAAGLDNRHIASKMGIGYVTVRTHLRNLSSKLDAHSKVEILARSAELGLIAR
jgi:non-specific serine/threonine protein kinase